MQINGLFKSTLPTGMLVGSQWCILHVIPFEDGRVFYKPLCPMDWQENGTCRLRWDTMTNLQARDFGGIMYWSKAGAREQANNLSVDKEVQAMLGANTFLAIYNPYTEELIGLKLGRTIHCLNTMFKECVTFFMNGQAMKHVTPSEAYQMLGHAMFDDACDVRQDTNRISILYRTLPKPERRGKLEKGEVN